MLGTTYIAGAKVKREGGLPTHRIEIMPGIDETLTALGCAIVRIMSRQGIQLPVLSHRQRSARDRTIAAKRYLKLVERFELHALLDLSPAESVSLRALRQFVRAQPFLLQIDRPQSYSAIVRDLLAQARDRQREMSGTMVMGAVMQHLVGAKLSLLPDVAIEHHSFATADAPTNRSGDFLVGSVAIHVTTAPSEALVGKCRGNLDAALRPMIVTTEAGVAGARALADAVEIAERIDVYDVAQFVSLNLHELSGFEADRSRHTVDALFAAYNRIVDEVEGDPSLRVDVST